MFDTWEGAVYSMVSSGRAIGTGSDGSETAMFTSPQTASSSIARRRRTCLARLKAAALLVVILTALSFAPNSLQAAERPWVRATSPNFELYTNKSEKDARKIIEHFERVRHVFKKLANFEVDPEFPTRLVVFRSQKDYEPFQPRENVAGFYNQMRGRDTIVMGESNTDSYEVAVHEYFHLVSRAGLFDLPPWFEEGLAQVYENMRINKKDVQIGRPIERHLSYMQQRQFPWTPLQHFFAVQSVASGHDAGMRMGEFYIQSWALAHMVMMDSEYRPKSGEFFRAMKEHGNGEKAFQDVYGMDIKQTFFELNKYVSKQIFQYIKIPMPRLEEFPSIEVSQATPMQYKLVFADVLTNLHRHDKAEAIYNELLESDPKSYELQEALAFAAIRDMDVDRAREHFRLAVEYGTEDPVSFARYAQLLAMQDPNNPEILKVINRSLAANPNQRKVREETIRLCLLQKEWEMALIHMSKLGPIKDTEAAKFFGDMAFAQYQLKEFDEARKSVKRALEYVQDASLQLRLEKMLDSINNRERYEEYQLASRAAAGQAGDGEAPALARAAVNEPEVRNTGAYSAEELVERQVSSFQKMDGSVLRIVRLIELRCNEETPAMMVRAGHDLLKLLFDKPNQVALIRGTEIGGGLNLQCGKQDTEKVSIGYLQNEDSTVAADGFIRLIHYLE
jgi:tetratricopeptide (TPR) repeat protein